MNQDEENLRHSLATRLGAPALLVFLATLLRIPLTPLLGESLIYVTYFPAVAVAAVYAGMWPGMLALALSVLAAQFWLWTDRNSYALTASDLLGASLFVFNGLIIVMVCDALHRARRRELQATVARLRAEETSLQSELRFRSVADAAPVLIWMSDATKACNWFNKPWLDFRGRSMEQEVGYGWVEGVHPQDRDSCVLGYNAAFDERKALSINYRLLRHDGQYRWMLDNGVPLFASRGGFIGYVGSCVDVTELKTAEQALRENEERLRLAIRAGATGIWDWDIAANHVTWSEQIFEFHGIRTDQFDGTVESFSKLVDPRDIQRVKQAIDAAMREHQDYHVEFRPNRPDGQERWLSTTGHVFYDETGNPVRMMGATIDITASKHVEQERESLLASERAARSEAERTSRMKDEFLATLSHELRTPLNAILGWSQVLNQSNLPQSDYQEGLSVIERNARAQTKLIEDLLDMSRIISGKIRLDVKPVDLPAVIDAAAESVQLSADAREIRIEKDVDAIVPIQGDPARLQQVVWNLLSNAIKFTPRRGTVRISMKRDGNNAVLIVSDSGMGIRIEFLPHIFQRFRQADASTTRKYGGLGLGLAIVKSLIELHGGTIEAHSAGEGHGASFRIELPLAMTREQETLDRATPGSNAAADHGNRGSDVNLTGTSILVIDDEPDARELIRRLLSYSGASVQSASSVREGIEAIRRQHFDLLISDIGMPEVDGYTLIRQLRADLSEHAEMPAIALSALTRPEDRIRAMNAGFDVFVAKPVEPSEIIAVAARLTRKT